jgi:hypothetical protein
LDCKDGTKGRAFCISMGSVKLENPEIKKFETSVFDGVYVTNDLTQEYLNKLDAARNEAMVMQEQMAKYLR